MGGIERLVRDAMLVGLCGRPASPRPARRSQGSSDRSSPGGCARSPPHPIGACTPAARTQGHGDAHRAGRPRPPATPPAAPATARDPSASTTRQAAPPRSPQITPHISSAHRRKEDVRKPAATRPPRQGRRLRWRPPSESPLRGLAPLRSAAPRPSSRNVLRTFRASQDCPSDWAPSQTPTRTGRPQQQVPARRLRPSPRGRPPTARCPYRSADSAPGTLPCAWRRPPRTAARARPPPMRSTPPHQATIRQPAAPRVLTRCPSP